MSRDFTLHTYKKLLESAINSGYTLTSYEDFIINGHLYKKVMILRHDVDDLPENSLETAILEQRLKTKGSYYFRIVKQSFHPDIIRKIKQMGHEIGYHYENMDRLNGNTANAYKDFCLNLNRFREICEIKTICMHGSPLSKWDNRDLWKKYNYKESGIIGEPYFDIDFNSVFYLTDTGRSWNKSESSVRDKVESAFKLKFDSTFSIIDAFEQNKMPKKIMLNIHPQRWANNRLLWLKEFVFQNIKNVIKRIITK